MNLNREAILNTGVCYWSEEDNCYIVESPLCNRTGGVGGTSKKAWKHFMIMVDELLEDVRIHGLYTAPGRPAKDTVNIHVQVHPETYKMIKRWQKLLGSVSQGEVLDYLAFFYDHLRNVKSKNSRSIKADKRKQQRIIQLPTARHGKATIETQLDPANDRAQRLRAINELMEFRRTMPKIPLKELLEGRHRGHKY